jgi:hypothetical protein
MRAPQHNSPDWDEEDPAFGLVSYDPDRMPGLPGSWSGYLWGMAGIGFALLWAAESIGALEGKDGIAGYNSFAGNMWNLFLVLAICYLIFRLSRPLPSGLAYILSGLSALYILITHTF